jgi:hypothetical protein
VLFFCTFELDPAVAGNFFCAVPDSAFFTVFLTAFFAGVAFLTVFPAFEAAGFAFARAAVFFEPAELLCLFVFLAVPFTDIASPFGHYFTRKLCW